MPSGKDVVAGLAGLGGSQRKSSKIVERRTKQTAAKTGRKLTEEWLNRLDDIFERLDSEDSST